ncbi:TPA: IS30 family transposase, partial [Raoultella planticola]
LAQQRQDRRGQVQAATAAATGLACFIFRFLRRPLNGKDATSVNQALTDKFLSLPPELRQSLTWDRGMELARHLEFTGSTGVKVYFCDPQSPWQRGTNENTNGLIRQYFPKKTCLAQYTQHELDQVAAQLNNRPRKTLKFKTPKEIIERVVALTD